MEGRLSAHGVAFVLGGGVGEGVCRLVRALILPRAAGGGGGRAAQPGGASGTSSAPPPSLLSECVSAPGQTQAGPPGAASILGQRSQGRTLTRCWYAMPPRLPMSQS